MSRGCRGVKEMSRSVALGPGAMGQFATFGGRDSVLERSGAFCGFLQRPGSKQ